MKKFLLGIALGIGGLALAQSIQKTLDLRVNGANAGKAYVIAGQSYVPVSALKPFNLQATQSGNTLSLGVQGGANQLGAVEGCLNETLFNGVVRLTVKSIEEITYIGRPTWGLTIEVRNGLSKEFKLIDAGSNTNGLFIATADGNPRSFGISAPENEAAKELIYKAVPAGGSIVYQLKFPTLIGASEPKPTKFIMGFDKTKALKEIKFAVADPSFRVNLECSK